MLTFINIAWGKYTHCRDVLMLKSDGTKNPQHNILVIFKRNRQIETFISQRFNFEHYNMCTKCRRCVLVLVWQRVHIVFWPLFSFLSTGKPKCFLTSDLKLAGASAVSQTSLLAFHSPLLLFLPGLCRWAVVPTSLCFTAKQTQTRHQDPFVTTTLTMLLHP